MKEVLILGDGPSLKDCPYDGELWVTCGVLTRPELADKHCSKMFAFDLGKTLEPYLQAARDKGVPIVSTRHYATEPYPYQAVVAECRSNFLKTSISYMIAYALYLGYEKLRLYGVDQGPEWDYIAGRPYVMHWLGVACGRGVEYELAPSSILKKAMKAHIKKRYKEIEASGDWEQIVRLAPGPAFVSGEGVKVTFNLKEE